MIATRDNAVQHESDIAKSRLNAVGFSQIESFRTSCNNFISR